MIRSAISTGSLPELNERPSWLPVDLCARAVVQLSLAENDLAGSDADLVYHLLNSATFRWREDLLPMLKQHPDMPSFEVVPPTEWLDRLAKSEGDVEKNPSIKLLDFWRGKYGAAPSAVKEQDDEPAGLTFVTERTKQDAEVLADVRDPVSEGLAARYVEVWMKKWRS